MKELTMVRLSAFSALSAVREAKRLCASEEEGALWRNACLLARAVFCDGRRYFADGRDVLERLTPETVACWAEVYGRLCGKPKDVYDGWEARKKTLASDPKGRLRWRIIRELGPGAVRMREEEIRDCILHWMLDEEEALSRLCPACREASRLQEGRCPICGSSQFGENPRFDEKRFEELKRRGLSEGNA